MVWDSEPFKCLNDPDDDLFLYPGDMPLNIDRFCCKTRQKPQETKGEYVRCIMKRLALKYGYVLESIEEITSKTYNAVHIVGGGSRDRMLCSFTACATGRKVIAGPVEATAIGNIVLQAVAFGQIVSLREARQVIRETFTVVAYQAKM